MKSLMRRINLIARIANQRLDQQLKQYDLKGSQVVYLINLYKHPGLSQDEIARDICVNKSNVARQLASLEEKGFIYRLVSENDKRLMQVYLTDKSKELMPIIRTINKQWNEYLLEEFTDDEKEQLLETIEKIAEKALDYSASHQE